MPKMSTKQVNKKNKNLAVHKGYSSKTVENLLPRCLNWFYFHSKCCSIEFFFATARKTLVPTNFQCIHRNQDYNNHFTISTYLALSASCLSLGQTNLFFASPEPQSTIVCWRDHERPALRAASLDHMLGVATLVRNWRLLISSLLLAPSGSIWWWRETLLTERRRQFFPERLRDEAAKPCWGGLNLGGGFCCFRGGEKGNCGSGTCSWHGRSFLRRVLGWEIL